MKQTERPLSPHLQVYKPQLTSVMSIMHRLTGLVQSLGMVIFVVWLYLLAQHPALAQSMTDFFSGGLGQTVLFVWVFTFFYHLSNGIRHLFWDTGKAFSIPAVYRSGYLVLFFAVVLTAAVFLLSR